MHEVQDVARVPAQAVQLDDDKDIARADELEDGCQLVPALTRAAGDLLEPDDVAASGRELGLLGGGILPRGGYAGVADQVAVGGLAGRGGLGAHGVGVLLFTKTLRPLVNARIINCCQP